MDYDDEEFNFLFYFVWKCFQFKKKSFLDILLHFIYDIIMGTHIANGQTQKRLLLCYFSVRICHGFNRW